MSGVFFYKEFNDHDLGNDESPLRQKFNAIIKDLEENKLTHQGSIKLISSKGGIKYLRAKLSDSGRLLFTSIEHNGKNIFVILEVILNHDYHKSKFLTNTDKEKIKNIKIISKEVSDTAGEVEIGDAPQVRWLGKFITFSAKQEEIVESAEGKYNLPLVVSGSAGSGKTSVALEKLRKIEEEFKEGRILYITKSKNLVKESKKLLEYEYYDETADECKIVAPEEIEFLSLHGFLEKRKEDIKGKKPIDRNKFFSWFNKECKKHKKYGEKIFEEFIAVIGGRGLLGKEGKDQYVNLGDRQSIFPKEERANIYSLFEKYKKFIEGSSEYYDTSLIAHECVEKVQANYDVVVVDEVQDLTESTLGLILKSLKDESNFLLCGDVNQVIHPSFFSLSRLKSCLIDKCEKKLKLCNLEKNYRNSKQVTEVGNRILHLKNYCFAPEDRITEEKKKLFFMESDTENPGNVCFVTKDKEQEMAGKVPGSINWAVLVLDDEKKEEARKLFSTPLVFNIHEAKGLEFENVILYKFTSNRAYNEIWNIVCPGKSDGEVNNTINRIRDSYNAKDVTTSRNKDKEDKSFEECKFYINALYVGITRAIDNVYVIDDEKKCNLLQIIKPEGISNIDIKKEESSPEEWRDMALKLIDEGNVEQAKGIAEKLLRERQGRYANEIMSALKAKEKDHTQESQFPLDKNEQVISELKIESTTPQKSPVGKSRIPAKNSDQKKGIAKLGTNKTQQDQNGDQEKYKRLLNIIRHNKVSQLKKMDISQYDKECMLNVALDNGNFKVAKYLIEQGADVNVSYEKGFTRLHLVAQGGHGWMVKLFLQYSKIDVNAKSDEGFAPLHVAAQNGHYDVVKLLLQHKADIDAKNIDDSTPLHMAATGGHAGTVKLLLDYGADVNATMGDCSTPLYLAAQEGFDSVVKLLLDNKADINAARSNSSTPLCIAAEEGHENVIKLLLGHEEVDVNAAMSKGSAPLHFAAKKSKVGVVKLLLGHEKVNVNATMSDGCTPLHCAAAEGNKDVVELLLDYEADVNAKCIDDFTPLYLAAQNGHYDVVKLLLQHKADIDAKDIDDFTPLHMAATGGHAGTVKLLLDYGADVNAKAANYTSLLLALKNSHSEVVDLLLADPNINVGCVKIGCMSCKNKKDKEKFLQKLDQDNKLFKKVEEAAREVDGNKVDELLREIKKLLESKSECGFKPSLNYSPEGNDENTTIKIAIKARGELLQLFKRAKEHEKTQPKSDLSNVSVSGNLAQAQALIT